MDVAVGMSIGCVVVFGVVVNCAVAIADGVDDVEVVVGKLRDVQVVLMMLIKITINNASLLWDFMEFQNNNVAMSAMSHCSRRLLARP
ncbi:MAG: hypothetical protein WHX53_16390 [Anaerolineae bacterium]